MKVHQVHMHNFGCAYHHIGLYPDFLGLTSQHGLIPFRILSTFSNSYIFLLKGSSVVENQPRY